MNSTQKNKSGVLPRCMENDGHDDAVFRAGCIGSFLQLAACGIMEIMRKEGTPDVLDDAKIGMGICFDLLQDMLEAASK